MTSPSTTTIPPTTPLPERFAPLFARIAEGTLEREQTHTLPREQVRWLATAGFGAVRLPVEAGGAGASVVQLAGLLTQLARADSNLAQIFRGHFAFVEDRLVAPASPERDAWLALFSAGEIVGNAWSETGPATVGTLGTRLTGPAGDWRLSGTKFYTTGSIFADWIDVTATRDDGTDVTVLVRSDAPGVTITDDWDGFGQPLTGTGTITFDGTPVEDAHVFRFEERFRYQTALYQLVLLTVLAGIARAAVDDTAALVASRSRVYSHGAASLAREDPQILAIVGEVASAAFVADATVARVAAAIDAAHATAHDRDSVADRDANIAAELASAQGQVVLTRLVTEAASAAFDALGASALRRSSGLDRHWRNARAVSSHNPTIYKARIVGDWEVNSTPPPFIWSIGTADSPAQQNRI